MDVELQVVLLSGGESEGGDGVEGVGGRNIDGGEGGGEEWVGGEAG